MISKHLLTLWNTLTIMGTSYIGYIQTKSNTTNQKCVKIEETLMPANNCLENGWTNKVLISMTKHHTISDISNQIDIVLIVLLFVCSKHK